MRKKTYEELREENNSLRSALHAILYESTKLTEDYYVEDCVETVLHTIIEQCEAALLNTAGEEDPMPVHLEAKFSITKNGASVAIYNLGVKSISLQIPFDRVNGREVDASDARTLLIAHLLEVLPLFKVGRDDDQQIWTDIDEAVDLNGLRGIAVRLGIRFDAPYMLTLFDSSVTQAQRHVVSRILQAVESESSSQRLS